MFGFLHMYETYRSRDNASWSGFTFTYKSHNSIRAVGGVPEDKQSGRMLFHGPTNTGLGTGNSFARSHLSDPLVLKVAFHLDTQTLQSSLTNAGAAIVTSVMIVGTSPPLILLYNVETAVRVGIKDIFHIEIGRRMNGME